MLKCRLNFPDINFILIKKKKLLVITKHYYTGIQFDIPLKKMYKNLLPKETMIDKEKTGNIIEGDFDFSLG